MPRLLNVHLINTYHAAGDPDQIKYSLSGLTDSIPT